MDYYWNRQDEANEAAMLTIEEGAVYRGNRAMRGRTMTVLTIRDDGAIRLMAKNGAKFFMARDKLQNNIDMGLLVRVW